MNGRARAGMPNDLAYESKFQNLTRLGFLSRGILYIVIAVLAVRTGRSEDMTGALKVISDGPGGWLLGLMGAGMAAYGLWRLADAVFGVENPQQDGKAYAKRAAAFVVGGIYLSLAYTAVQLLTSNGASGSGEGSPLPSSSWVMAAAALVMVVAAGSQFVTAFKCSFLNKMDTPPHSEWIEWLGRIGYTARGFVFGALAYLFGRAALSGGSSDVGGTEQALSVFDGTVWLAIAVGLGIFGIFSIIEARYRRIRRPPVG